MLGIAVTCNNKQIFIGKMQTLQETTQHCLTQCVANMMKDFTGGEGTIFFKSGETTKDIKIPIIDDMSASGTEEFFEVELFELSNEGCKFGSIPRTTVTIANDEEYQQIIDNMIALTNKQLEELSLYQTSWSKQLKAEQCCALIG